MKSPVGRPLRLIAMAVTAGVATAGSAWAEYPYEAYLAEPPAPVVIEEEASQSDIAVPVADAAPSADSAPAAASAPVTSAPCACCNSHCCTKEKKEAATAKMKGAYKGLFYANDFSYLNDPCYRGPDCCTDVLKGLCCNRLDIGGEARLRFHDETNHRGVGLTGRDDDFWLTRVRLFANYRMNEYFRFYGEYLYADSAGENFTARGIEENHGDVTNLFVDAKLLSNLTLRVGRQELLYSGQRLISPLDWANTRRTFEGVKLLYQGENWDIDGFFTHPVQVRTSQEDKAINTTDFYGVYASRGDLSIGTLDAYYLGYDNSVADFEYHTIGSRVYGKSDGGMLYDFEGGVQFGNNTGGSDHGAGFFTAGLGRKLSICTSCGEWNPTVWMWYDWASGEKDFADVGRGDDGFDHLFPLAHKYNGFIDLFGRRNLNDVNAQFITPLGKKVSLLLWYHYFFLDQKTTPYNVNMTPFNTASAAGDRELGHEIDVLFNINVNARNNVLLGYSFFNAGKYYDTTANVPTNGDAQFFYRQYQTRF